MLLLYPHSPLGSLMGYVIGWNRTQIGGRGLCTRVTVGVADCVRVCVWEDGKLRYV